MRKLYYLLLALLSDFYKVFSQRQLRVLAYHHIPDQQIFRKQAEYLKSHYNIIGIETLREHIFDKQPLPKYPLLITFDDGYTDNLENGLPIFKELGIPAVIFVVTAYMDTERDFWWRSILQNEREGRKKINWLKTVSNKERMVYLTTMVTDRAHIQLTSNDLQLLQSHKVSIGNHTHTHAYLDKSTEDEIKEELSCAKEFFRKNNLKGYDVFAYPNGNATGVAEKIIKEEGIKMAFLFDHKLNPKNINPLRISRIRANADMSLNELKAKVSGLHSLVYR